mmetsp:Transcript_14069/g.41242  ORF Transcript_14069/g.41242 Transcript_14069/m.41242 type:complete len:276 (-) Transcript_14069:105-932(-)
MHIMKDHMSHTFSNSPLSPVEQSIASLEYDEEPTMAEEASRSIFRETDDAMPFPPTVTRASPINCGVGDYDRNADGGSEEIGYTGRDSTSLEYELSSSHFTSQPVVESDDLNDDDMLDFDWTENADYEPAAEMNPVLHHNAGNAEFQEPMAGQQINYSAFFNTGSSASLINMDTNRSESGINQVQQESHLNQCSSSSMPLYDENSSTQDLNISRVGWEQPMHESRAPYFATRNLGPTSRVSTESQSTVALCRSTSSSSSDSSVADFLPQMKHFSR